MPLNFYRRELRRIDSLANTVGVISETYIGWPNAGQARAIVQACDRVLVSAYVSNEATTYSYTRPRLIDLAGGSIQAKVMPIFSSEPVFMGPWAQTHTPLQAFTNYSVNFANETGSWKSNVSLLGYQWFAYSFMPKTLTLGAHELSSNKNAMIYPNPVSNGQLIIECNRCEVVVLNGTGQVMHVTSKISGNHREVDVSNLDNGIYFVSVNGTFRKIIISK